MRVVWVTPNDVLRFNHPDWVAMQIGQQGLDALVRSGFVTW